MKQTNNLSNANDDPVKRILIYRLGSLGDTIVALPSLHLVARAFPNAERRMLTNLPVNSKAPAAAAVLDGMGLVHGYFTYKAGMRGIWQLLSLWWQIVRWRPQVLVYMAAFRGTKEVARDSRFFWICGIRRQVGVPRTTPMQQNLWRDISHSFEHEASRLARNLADLGEARLDEPASWDLRPSAPEIAASRGATRPAAGRPLLAVSVGTKVQAKDWGRENWRQLMFELGTLYPQYALVLCGAKEETASSDFAGSGWKESAGPEAVVINLCGSLSPRESAAVLADARLFIGHDSGPMHLAASAATPCVAIFAARNKPGTWFPYGSGHRVIYHQVDCWGCGLETCTIQQKKCITSISVGEVLAEVVAALDRPRKKERTSLLKSAPGPGWHS